MNLIQTSHTWNPNSFVRYSLASFDHLSRALTPLHIFETSFFSSCHPVHFWFLHLLILFSMSSRSTHDVVINSLCFEWLNGGLSVCSIFSSPIYQLMGTWGCFQILSVWCCWEHGSADIFTRGSFHHPAITSGFYRSSIYNIRNLHTVFHMAMPVYSLTR